MTLAANAPLVALTWVLFAFPAAIGITLLANRLLGVGRGWTSLLTAGIAGWLTGLIIAGLLNDWVWSSIDMVLVTLALGSLLTMMFAVGLDLLAPPGSLAKGSAAGRFVVPHPVRELRAKAAPVSRYREVVRIAAANGLGPSLVRSGGEVRLATVGVRLRQTLEQAGGMFVKLGQVASTRTDLLPPELCQDLAGLRSAAKAEPAAVMGPFLEAELDAPVEEVFADFDWTPIAAASIAQVYPARLRDGTEVVVKVQRPGLETVVARDTAALMQVADVLENRTTLGLSLRPLDLAREFIGGLREELDFGIEAANAAALAAATPPELGVRIPAVHTELSTRRVLVEERLTGVSIADVAALRSQGHDPDALAERFLHAMVHHVFEVGTFHADPHPGNVLVLPDGTIGLIDLGAVGHLGPAERDALVLMVLGAASGDAGQMRQGLSESGVVGNDVDAATLDRALAQFVQQNLTAGGGISASTFQDLLPLLGEFGMRPPRWLATLGRTMVTLEGTLRAVSPSFSLVDALRGIAAARARTLASPDSWREVVSREAMVQLPRLRRLPERVDDLLDQAARGRLSARVSLFGHSRDVETATRLVNRVVMGGLAAALGIGSVALVGVEAGPTLAGAVSLNEVLGYLGLAGSAVLFLRVIAVIVRDGLW